MAAAGYATATLVIRRCLADLTPVCGSAASLVLSAALLAMPAGLTLHPHRLTATALAVLAMLGVGCTGLAFWAFYALIAEVGATRAVVSIYLTPAVAVVLGMTLLNEHLTVTIATGLILIAAGSWISTRGADRPEKVEDP